VSALAAKVGLIAGPLLFYLLVFVFGDTVQVWLKSTFHLVDDVHFLHFLASVFVLTVILMLVISIFKPAKRIYEQEYTHDVDITPWKHAKLAGLVVSVAAILFYILLAQ